MKVIQSGDEYNVYGNGVMTYDALPTRTYTVEFDPMRGCFLQARSNIEVTEKAYGAQEQKIDKVMNAFRRADRSLGVILSGDKGIGKTMFSKKLCQRFLEEGMPVILVDECYPRLSQFLGEIDQECVILFDEFEKMFDTPGDDYEDECEDEQAKLLSLFDGTSGGKKLFVVTCNEIEGLNDCFINRPGRFHYHFRFEYPSADEIKAYMSDKLEDKYHGEISKVVAFAKRIKLNYDCLRAIAFELNTGIGFEEAISDLNILNLEEYDYDVTLYFEDGKTLHETRYSVDLYNRDDPFGWVELHNAKGEKVVDAKFNKNMLMNDVKEDAVVIPAKGISLDYDDYDEDERTTMVYRKKKPVRLTFSLSRPQNLHYFM